MSDVLDGWASIEEVAVAYLSDGLGKPAATETPDDLDDIVADEGGFLRVSRGPGSDDGVTDRPLLDVEAFAGSRTAAERLAEDARQRMHALRGRAVNGALIDRVTTSVGPVWLDYGTKHLHRYVASYRIEFRRRR